ncbi:TnsA-like heteromeric transposase endonuclease subunit [Amycolatopsis sp. YIM 10]|uniref:TnsA-like heteromeric transposase endonuclease subunit n=1 Tax=Amycolatopsis sp. YIM 10 TaxID=2653857 RepID=UPI001D13A406|nr:TnsA-like heteromeric transposase endonuclease subunit [Amycolatopsis sp. YIM 10]
MITTVSVCVLVVFRRCDGSSAVAAELPGAGFGLRYICPSGQERQDSLAIGWNVRFEHTTPVRAFSSYRGQRNFPGQWWSATTGELVGFESWLERDQVMLLDFSPKITAFSSQPFWLTWLEDGKLRRHAPDYFARSKDGAGIVIDVRADEQIGPDDAVVFATTAQACDLVGWTYRRVGAVAPILLANVRWLSGYRHPRCRNNRYAGPLMAAFAVASPLLPTAKNIGDPLAVLPTLFHLLWSGVLIADLTGEPLSANTAVTMNGGC